MSLSPLAAVAIALTLAAAAPDGNRLAYLDGNDPYYPGRDTPRLVTPQWIGEAGVDAAVVLTVDDLNDATIGTLVPYLRPILDRLRAIDNRAPISLFAGRVDPADPRLRDWILGGANVEVHSLSHAQPLLGRAGFRAARDAVHGGLDRLVEVPGNRPVAFRIPSCTNLEALSPRLLSEIVEAPSPGRNLLTIDSSVPCRLASGPSPLPRAVVSAEPVASDSALLQACALEDYPYPYVVDGLIWELPWVRPSGQFTVASRGSAGTPRPSLDELKAGLDRVVARQGVFVLRLGPAAGLEPEQVVGLIDHAVRAHGRRVRFLNFREVQERLDANLLRAAPVRDNEGLDNGVRVVDLNDDGYMDVVIGNDRRRMTRLWDPAARAWIDLEFPVRLVGRGSRTFCAHHPRFGVVRPDGRASFLVSSSLAGQPFVRGAWHFDNTAWVEAPELLEGLTGPSEAVLETATIGIDKGVRLRDLDGDGRCELIAGSDQLADVRGIFAFTPGKGWKPLPFDLPGDARVVMTRGPEERTVYEPDDITGQDAGLRFVDLDDDGRLDVVYSNDRGYGIFLFESLAKGWSRRVAAGHAGAPEALPPIVRVGGDAWQSRNTRDAQGRPLLRVGRPTFITSNGFWSRGGSFWWQNENTEALPEHLDRRSVDDLLKAVVRHR